MQVLVGIPTHKRPELLRLCLESIEKQDGDLPEVRVFVADNDANGRAGAALATELADKFRFPLASTVVNEPGISAVRNTILEEARRRNADFIAMIDDDETASPQWLGELLRVQSMFETGVVGGPVIPVFPDGALEWIRSGFRRLDRKTGIVDLVDATGNVMISCRALQDIGWPAFDHAYGLSGGGDTEFFLRARKLGITFAWANEATAEERVPITRHTAAWFIRRQFRYGNTSYRLRRLHGLNHLAQSMNAMMHLASSPLWLVLAMHPRTRLRALRTLAYSAGVVSSMMGYRYFEYAERHR